MEGAPKNEFLNKVERELRDKIAFAKINAISESEYDEIIEAEREMQSIQTQRELTDKEVHHYHHFRDKMNLATVDAETIPEATRAMELLGFDKASLIDTIAHENAHGNRAEELGAEHLGYKFLLIKDENGGLIVQPQASTYIPDEWDKEYQKAVHSEILWAPEDYENKISPGDREDLENLYKD